jgi:hypothetical protein
MIRLAVSDEPVGGDVLLAVGAEHRRLHYQWNPLAAAATAAASAATLMIAVRMSQRMKILLRVGGYSASTGCAGGF